MQLVAHGHGVVLGTALFQRNWLEHLGGIGASSVPIGIGIYLHRSGGTFFTATTSVAQRIAQRYFNRFIGSLAVFAVAGGRSVISRVGLC